MNKETLETVVSFRMDSSAPRDPGGSPGRTAAKAGRIAVPLALLAAGWVGFLLLSVEPEEPRRPAPEPRTIKTTVRTLHRQDYQTRVTTQGVVRPHNEVTLTPQVSGQIVRLLPAFEDGAFFEEGEVLLELERADFETAVVTAEAALARAEATLAQEEARARQARLNWEDLGYEDEPNDLVLRLPQLREAEANVASARAQLEQARRNLERTRVRAPFDGRVRERIVGLGQSVGPGTTLGTVFSVDFAEVRLPIAADDLAFLDLPEAPDDPSVRVELRDLLNDANETVWRGRVVRTEGALDESSLDLFAIARVDDPFGRRSGLPPLRIGQPVRGVIAGRVLQDVQLIPRAAIRQVDRIYLVDPDELTLQGLVIDAIWSDADHVVVRHPDIPDGAILATSPMTYAPENARVEILPDPAGPDGGTPEGEIGPGGGSDGNQTSAVGGASAGVAG